MKVDELVTTARDTLSSRRVYGEPYVQDGVTFIAAARVSGMAGGGGGTDQQGQQGEGGGFGLQARPAGAYVIRDGRVQWMPAVDVNRALSVIAVVLVALFISRVRIRKLAAKQAVAATLLSRRDRTAA